MSSEIRRPGIEEVKSFIEGLLHDRFFDGVVRHLLSRYPGSSHEMAEDAVSHAVEVLLRRAGKVTNENLQGYLMRVAKNRMSRLLNEAGRREEEKDRLVGPDGRSGWEDGETHAVVQESFYKFVLGNVGEWPTETQRIAAELRLQAAWEDVPMSDHELAEEMETILSRSITRGDAAQHWRRARSRIARELTALFEDSDEEGT